MDVTLHGSASPAEVQAALDEIWLRGFRDADLWAEMLGQGATRADVEAFFCALPVMQRDGAAPGSAAPHVLTVSMAVPLDGRIARDLWSLAYRMLEERVGHGRISRA